jgi:riboflavin biosynthesis pyrimidine reductase
MRRTGLFTASGGASAGPLELRRGGSHGASASDAFCQAGVDGPAARAWAEDWRSMARARGDRGKPRSRRRTQAPSARRATSTRSGESPAAAGDRDVAIQGGATTINQSLAAGLIDELRLHIVPLTLGAGTRLFEGVPPLKLEQVKSRAARQVTHVTYRVLS